MHSLWLLPDIEQFNAIAKQPAIIMSSVDDGCSRAMHYGELKRAVDACIQTLNNFKISPEQKLLIAINARCDIHTVITWLAALAAGHTCWLLDDNVDATEASELFDTFQPNLWLNHDRQLQQVHQDALSLAPELALLMNTSGSTGGGQLVRLSYRNIEANTASIRQILPIQSDDTAITTLPLHYSFGLSLLNTHLNAGAAVVLSSDSIMSKPFWQTMKHQRVTSLYGVPFVYDMLVRLRLERLDLSHIRYLAHAGGALSATTFAALVDWSESQQRPVFTMYGQTEATARIAWVKPPLRAELFGAIGQAIPGGSLVLKDEAGNTVTKPGQVGELFYQGENVMLGYAKNMTDLHASVVSSNNWLATGDMARCDEQGNYFITGRKKRMVKITGHRISLDDTERKLKERFTELELLICAGEDDRLMIVTGQRLSEDTERQMIASLGFHSRYIQFAVINEVPRTSSGKVNYAELTQQVVHG